MKNQHQKSVKTEIDWYSFLVGPPDVKLYDTEYPEIGELLPRKISADLATTKGMKLGCLYCDVKMLPKNFNEHFKKFHPDANFDKYTIYGMKAASPGAAKAKPKPGPDQVSEDKVCEICKKVFSGSPTYVKKALYKHMRKHKEYPEFVCEFCNLKVPRKEASENWDYLYRVDYHMKKYHPENHAKKLEKERRRRLAILNENQGIKLYDSIFIVLTY